MGDVEMDLGGMAKRSGSSATRCNLAWGGLGGVNAVLVFLCCARRITLDGQKKNNSDSAYILILFNFSTYIVHGLNTKHTEGFPRTLCLLLPLPKTRAEAPDAMATTARLPTKADFPSTLTFDIIPPPFNKAPLNILILLHGLGDSQTSFARLASQLNLRDTACLALRGPNPIPPIFTGSDAPAFHWADDVLFDEGKGAIDLDGGFKTAERALGEVVEGLRACGFGERGVLWLGFGQGGMAAMHFLCASSSWEFGGVVSIGGKLPSSSAAATKSKTPVLLLGGSRSTEVTRSAVDAVKASFADVEYVKWDKREDSMPGSRDEMWPIMKFFARRLKSRAGVPEGAVEL